MSTQSSKDLRAAACRRDRAGPRIRPVRKIRRARPANAACSQASDAGAVRLRMDDVVYGCEKCGTEAKRTIKRT